MFSVFFMNFFFMFKNRGKFYFAFSLAVGLSVDLSVDLPVDLPVGLGWLPSSSNVFINHPHSEKLGFAWSSFSSSALIKCGLPL